MKANDYVRTITGKIYKLTENDLKFEMTKQNCKISSPKIIDLIEIGDYVNELPVLHKENNELVCGLFIRYKEEDIQNVVTKEQFKDCMYKVGE